MEESTCQHCGRSLSPGAAFCSACGRGTGTPQQALVTTQEIPPAVAAAIAQLQAQQQINTMQVEMQKAFNQLALHVRSMELGHFNPVIAPLLTSNAFMSRIPGTQITGLSYSRQVDLNQAVTSEAFSLTAEAPKEAVKVQKSGWERFKEEFKDELGW